jgi:hypothetical protein
LHLTGNLQASNLLHVFQKPIPPNYFHHGLLGSTIGALRTEMIGSLFSGIVGVVAWRLGPSVGKTFWSALPTSALPSGQTLNFYSLYPIWQMAMALFIAAMVAHRRLGDQSKITTESAKANS